MDKRQKAALAKKIPCTPPRDIGASKSKIDRKDILKKGLNKSSTPKGSDRLLSEKKLGSPYTEKSKNSNPSISSKLEEKLLQKLEKSLKNSKNMNPSSETNNRPEKIYVEKARDNSNKCINFLPIPSLEPTRWILSLDKDGIFQHDGDGIFQLFKDDVLEIYSSYIRGIDGKEKMIVQNGIGDIETVLPHKVFEDGVLFVWSPQVSGSHKICFEVIDYELNEALQFDEKKNDKMYDDISLKISKQTVKTKADNIIVVHPKFEIIENKEKKLIDIKSSSILTLLPRNLGKVRNWYSRMQQLLPIQYRFIHFAPLNEPGSSNSYYSLNSHLKLANELFDDSEKDNEEKKKKILTDVIKKIQHELQIFCTVDIVLNHVANCSKWLLDNPEAGYSLHTSPYLLASIELDERLHDFCQKIYEKQIDGLDNNINSEDKLNLLMKKLEEHVLEPFDMKTWYKLDENKIIDDYNNNKVSAKIYTNDEMKQKKYLEDEHVKHCDTCLHTLSNATECISNNINNLSEVSLLFAALYSVGERRNGVYIPPCVTHQFSSNVEDLKHLLIYHIQPQLDQEATNTYNDILTAIKGTVQYERFVEKKGIANDFSPLIPRYFTKIIPTKKGKEKIIKQYPYESSQDQYIKDIDTYEWLANNGWVMNWNTKKDFTAKGAHVYLKRRLISWGDCVKLRYGENPSCNESLWQMMEEYCKTNAKIFSGFRLDNCHSTPIHVADHLLREARKVNHNLFVYAELFTSNEQSDYDYVNKLGINTLIREAIHCRNAYDFSYQLVKFCDENVGNISTESLIENTLSANYDHLKCQNHYPLLGPYETNIVSKKKINELAYNLRKTIPTAIFYDCTHDNPMPSQFASPLLALSLIVGSTAANTANGSSYGFDLLLNKAISVVNDNRLYKEFSPIDISRLTEVINRLEKKGEQNFDGNDLSPIVFDKIMYNENDTVDNKVWEKETEVTQKRARSERRQSKIFDLKEFEDKEILSLSHLSAHDRILSGDDAFQTSKCICEIKWTDKKEYTQILVCGEWDDWKGKYELKKDNNNVWKTYIGVQKPNMYYSFKYIVDNEWTISSHYPVVESNDGQKNNLIVSITNDKNRITKRHSLSPHVTDVIGWNDETVFGLSVLKSFCNRLHTKLYSLDYHEIRSYALNDEVVVIQRYNPKLGKSYWFVTSMTFSEKANSIETANTLPSKDCFIELDGLIQHIHLAAMVRDVEPSDSTDNQIKSNKCKVFMDAGEIPSFFSPQYTASSNNFGLRLRTFPTGACIIFETYCDIFEHANSKAIELQKELPDVLRNMTLLDANFLLFSCDSEERDRSQSKMSTYDVPNLGKLAYGGFAGIYHWLEETRRRRIRQGGAFYDNLMSGDWLINYIVSRLRNDDDNYKNSVVTDCIKQIGAWLGSAFSIFDSNCPVTKPFLNSGPVLGGISVLRTDAIRVQLWWRTFDWAISTITSAIFQTIFNIMPDYVKKSTDPFVRRLVLSTLQFYSYTPSAPLLANTFLPCIAAGLPHFSTGFMRAWGRDTFIALPGILLSTQRFEEAKQEILNFATVLRHGLIPNLLDSGNNPRYNARDATWFFLHAVCLYVEKCPKGFMIFNEKVHFKYNAEDRLGDVINHSPPETLGDLFTGILQAHASGISFREWNAGEKIDSQMKSEGFDINIYVNKQNGFIYGGNKFNCGTWMDKMGSSSRANNKGVPASSRDGAPIELVAILYNVLKHAVVFHKNNWIKRDYVKFKEGESWKYEEWRKRIQSNFLKEYLIPHESKYDEKFNIDTNELYQRVTNDNYINQNRMTLKDVSLGEECWRQYMVRCNSMIIFSYAHDLLPYNLSLYIMHRTLNSLLDHDSIGLKTLSKYDPLYNPNYNNGLDNDNFWVANGFNYHNGPEWVWVYGLMLLSRMKLSMCSRDKMVIEYEVDKIWKLLYNHKVYIKYNEFQSLPELTNENGAYCSDSCTAQAWSVGTIVQFIEEYYNYKQKRN